MPENEDAGPLDVLLTVTTLGEAEVLVGLLTSQGIDAEWRSSDAGGVFPNLDVLEGVAILVPRGEIARARAALADVEPLAEGEEPPTGS